MGSGDIDGDYAGEGDGRLNYRVRAHHKRKVKEMVLYHQRAQQKRSERNGDDVRKKHTQCYGKSFVDRPRREEWRKYGSVPFWHRADLCPHQRALCLSASDLPDVGRLQKGVQNCQEMQVLSLTWTVYKSTRKLDNWAVCKREFETVSVCLKIRKRS
jgi:hypothetical protein